MKFITPKVLALVCVLIAAVLSRQSGTASKKQVESRKALMILNKQKTRVATKLQSHPIKDYLEHQRKNQSVKKGVRRFKVDVKLPNKNFTKFMKIGSHKNTRKNLAASRGKLAEKKISAATQKPKESSNHQIIQRNLKVQIPNVEIDSSKKSIVKDKSSELDQVFDELKTLDMSLHQIKDSDVNMITKQTQDKLIDVLSKYKEVLQQNPIDEKSFMASKVAPPARELINLEAAPKVSKQSFVEEIHAEPKDLKLKTPIQSKRRAIQPLVPSPKAKLVAKSQKSQKPAEKKMRLAKNEAKASVKKMEEAIDRLKNKLDQIAESKKQQVDAIPTKKEKSSTTKEKPQQKLKKNKNAKKAIARKAKTVSEETKKNKNHKAKINRKLGKTVHKIDRTSTTLVTVKISKPPKNISFLNPENNKSDFYKFKNKSFRLSAQISNLRFMLQKLNTCYERVHEIQLANHDTSLFSVECRDELIIVLRAIVELKKWSKSIIYRFILSNTNVRTLSVLDHELRLPRPLNVSKLSVPFGLFYNNLRLHYSQFRLKTYIHRYEHQCQTLIQFFDQAFANSLPIIQEMAKSLEYTHAMSVLIEFNHEVQIFKQVNTLIEEHKHEILHESIATADTEDNGSFASNMNANEKLLDFASKIHQDQISNQVTIQQGIPIEFAAASSNLNSGSFDSEPLIGEHKVIYSPCESENNSAEPKDDEDDEEEETNSNSITSNTQQDPQSKQADEKIEDESDDSSDQPTNTEEDGEVEDDTPVTSQKEPDCDGKQPLIINYLQPVEESQLKNQLPEPFGAQQNELAGLKSIIQGLEKQMKEISAQLPPQKEKTLDDEIREKEQKVQKSLSDPASLKVEEPITEKPAAKEEPEEKKQTFVISSPQPINIIDDIEKVKIFQQNPNGPAQQVTPIILNAEELKANIKNIPTQQLLNQNPQPADPNVMSNDQKMRIFANLLKQIPTNNPQNVSGLKSLPSGLPANDNEDEEDEDDDKMDFEIMPQFNGPASVPKFPSGFSSQQVTRPTGLPFNAPMSLANQPAKVQPKIVENKNSAPKKGLLFSSGPIYHPQIIDKFAEKPSQEIPKVQVLPKIPPVNAFNLPRPNNNLLFQQQPWRNNLPNKWTFDDEVKPVNTQVTKPPISPAYNRLTGQPDAKIFYKPTNEQNTKNLINKESINNRQNDVNNISNLDIKNNLANPVNKPLLSSDSKPSQLQQASQPKNESITGVLDLKIPYKGSKTGTFKTPTGEIDLTVNHIEDGKPKTKFVYENAEKMRQLTKLNLSNFPSFAKPSTAKDKVLSDSKVHKKPEESNYKNSFGKIKIIEQKENKRPQSKKLLQNRKSTVNQINSQISSASQNKKTKSLSMILPAWQRQKADNYRALQKQKQPVVRKVEKALVNNDASKVSFRKLDIKNSVKNQGNVSAASKKISKQATWQKVNSKKFDVKKMAKEQQKKQNQTRKNVSRSTPKTQQKLKAQLAQKSLKNQQAVSRQLRDNFRRRIRI